MHIKSTNTLKLNVTGYLLTEMGEEEVQDTDRRRKNKRQIGRREAIRLRGRRESIRIHVNKRIEEKENLRLNKNQASNSTGTIQFKSAI